MLKKFTKDIFIILIVFISSFLNGQNIPTGLRTDISGQNFYESYSPFTYLNDSNLIVRYKEKYEPGYCYLNSGDMLTGFIKLDDNKIYYKEEHESAFSEKIKAQKIQSVKIGIDSFFTSSNYYYKQKLQTQPTFLQYLGTFNGHIFARHFKISSKSNKKYTVVKSEESAWEEFYPKKSFIKQALRYFGHIQYLKDKIESGTYTEKNLSTLIKIAEYHQHYLDKKPIYFDSYWTEIKSSENAAFKAFVTDKKDSIYTIEYFNNKLKIYTINYSSFTPNIKEGTFTSFYKNGNKQKEIIYTNNKPEKIKTYSYNGSLINDFEITGPKKEKPKTNLLYSKYIADIDKSKLNGNYNYTILDTISGYSWTKVYKNNSISKMYRLREKDTIFQVVKTDVFETYYLLGPLDYYNIRADFSSALKDNAQGTVLISLLINPKRTVEEYQILNKIHPDIDGFVKTFCKNKFTQGAKFNHKFTKLQNYNKGYYQTVISISFENNRFYKAPRSNYNYDFMWQQQMMMQHQMSIPPPNPGRAGF